MSIARAVVIVASVTLAFAVALALVSRTPRSIRLDKPPANATDPSHGAHFTSEEIARNGRFRQTGYVAFVLGSALEILVLVVLGLGPLRRLAGAVESLPGTWALHAALVAAAAVVVITVTAMPLGYVTGYAMAKAWGLSTQNVAGWLSDQGRTLLIAMAISAITAVAFFGVVRWQPRLWWLFGWLAVSVIAVVVTYLYPVVISPLFNEFTPLHDPPLQKRILAVADEAGVHLDQVLVSDASRRTTAENAYVAGFGGTKRLVVYDTLLRSEDDDGVVFIVAHELGHEIGSHVLKGLGLAVGGTLVAFGVLAVLGRSTWFWSWAGASGPGDLKAIPVLLLFALVVNLLALPITNGVSRRFEASADRAALRLTQDPRAGVKVFRKLAFNNLADLRPPAPAVWALFTHPPIPDRIEVLLHPDAAGGDDRARRRPAARTLD